MNTRPDRPRLPTGVIVTYNPPPGLGARLHAALAGTDRVIVVDNGSVVRPQLDGLAGNEAARVDVLPLDRNIGLAAALNRGIERAWKDGATHVLLLDHDSVPEPGMTDLLLRAMGAHDAPVIAAVPRIAYAHPAIRCRWPASPRGGRWRFKFAYASQLDAPQPVDLAIGSGMLVDVAAWNRIGRFDEALFIDLVDTEFCLRARTQGYDVLAVPQAVLSHALGDVEQRRLLGIPVYPTHHNALRHYYLSRNRVILARRYARRFPNWLFYETMSALKLVIKVVLYEPQKGAKITSTWRGTLAGLRMRGGDGGTPARSADGRHSG